MIDSAYLLPITPSSHITTFYGHNKKSILDRTDQIQKAAQEYIPKRDERARSLLNAARFDLALKEAMLIQALAPTSSTGYLRAADVFQSQGQHYKAVVVCEKALEIVPPTDPSYAKLKTNRIQALNVSDKRIDFITQLFPGIVMTYIIPLLCENVKWNHSNGCPYLYVSRRWRQLISYCNMLEYQITLHEYFPSWDQFSELMQFAPHVKVLSINNDSDMVSDTHAILVSNPQYPNLKTLEYTGMCRFTKELGF